MIAYVLRLVASTRKTQIVPTICRMIARIVRRLAQVESIRFCR